MRPRWKHDCTQCKFVGVYLNGDGLNDAYNDVYVCDKGSIIEIVIRHSDEGSDYWSGSVFKKEEEK